MLWIFSLVVLLLAFVDDHNRCSDCSCGTSNSAKLRPALTAAGASDRKTSAFARRVESDAGFMYRFAIISDLDRTSRSPTKEHAWISHFRVGSLHLSFDESSAAVTWHDAEERLLTSSLALGGRSMELSDLKRFNGDLLTVDDRTGIVYKILLPQMEAMPWLILSDGSGNENKAFKAEWMTVKDDLLYVGGLGKEWTTITGEFVNYNPMWIKVISTAGIIHHIDWRKVYSSLRAAAGIHYPGYMIHESAQWSDVHHKWFFLPRRASNLTYTEEADEQRGTNYLLIADEDFNHITVQNITPLTKTRGFSAFQFIPETSDQLIVALKTEEDSGLISSYITVFHLNGTVLLNESRLPGNVKFEGIEFI